MWDQIKNFGTGIAEGVMGFEFGDKQVSPVVKAGAVKRTPNQTTMPSNSPVANPNGVAPYMKPGSQGPAISGPANEAINKKKRKAPGQMMGNFEMGVLGQEGVQNIQKLEGMEGILDMAIGGEDTVSKAHKDLNDQIEDIEPVQQMEKDAIEAGADVESEEGFDLQKFGRLLGSVAPGGRKAPMHQVSSHKAGSGAYKSKGLWDQRITKEWMDIYNKPLYTPLHKVAAAMR